VLYKEAATLDLLSEGRFELGIGAGWLKSEYDMAGLPFDPPALRVARMEETVRIVKGLAAAGPFTFAGEHYQINALEGMPKPVQRPYPPLYIGGGGKRLLSFAAREADIVGLAPKALPDGGLDVRDVTAAAVRRKLGWIREAAAEASRAPELNILIFVLEITDDRRGGAERHAAEFPGLTPDDILASPHVLIGTPAQIVEDLRQRRAEYGLSYIVINTVIDEHREQFAPVVALLAGQ
jgi:probable F420-dependent oxidoreductase